MISESRYRELIEVCNNARILYMQGADSGISNELYDSYMDDIRKYEAQNQAASNSPTNSVNPSLGDEDVKHPYRMLSLEDVFTPEDVGTYIRKHSRDLVFSVEYKLDGLSVQLIYKDGKLMSAATRGDGDKGVECIGAARYIPSIPKEIGVSGDVVVRGEVFMTKSSFEQYCKRYGTQANPRNTAVGIFKRKNELDRAKYLTFKAFNLENADDRRNEVAEASAFWGADSHQQCLKRMDIWGFEVVKHWVITTDEQLYAIIEEVRKNREEEDIPIDGLVIKIDDLDTRQRLGDNGKTPHWAVAYKFPAQEQETDLLDIEWQVGSSGALTPVAILTPVPVMGSMISKATLHNNKRIQDLDLQIGDKVVVYKAGDIIPAIKSTRHTDNSKPVIFPVTCPSCGSTLSTQKVKPMCTNIECREKLLARLSTWADKKVGNFKGVAGAVITALYDRGKLRTPADFYKIKPIDIMTIPGSGNSKMRTYMQRVTDSRTTMTFAQVLVGLGITDLAQAGAAEVEAYAKKHYSGNSFADVLDRFMRASGSVLQSILGEAKGMSVWQQLQDPFIQTMISNIGEVFKDRTI